MKRSRLFVLAPIFAAMILGATGPRSLAESKGETGFRFPVLKATNLEKRSLSLPQDFAGSHNLLLIAFQRRQQKDVDTWLVQMKQFEAIDPALRYYELPVIARLNPLTRWFIENGMRGGIQSSRQRERTITLYVDKGPFRAALGIPDEDHIYNLLIDRDGNILWRAEGTFDDNKGNSLKQALERLTRSR
jgi:hypothetical protein